jgi:hypothetical protein
MLAGAIPATADPTAAGNGFAGAYGMCSELQNQVLSQSYSDVFLIGGVASPAGMILAFFLPGRRRA